MKLRISNWTALLVHTRLAERWFPLSSLSYCSLSTTLRCADQDGETSPGLVCGPLVISWVGARAACWRFDHKHSVVFGFQRLRAESRSRGVAAASPQTRAALGMK